MRILDGQAADAFVTNLENRGSRLDEVEPAVRRIVEDVRRNKDRALVKYAHELDGLGSAQPLQVCESEMKDAWKHAPVQLQTALRKAANNIRQFCEWQNQRTGPNLATEFLSGSWFARLILLAATFLVDDFPSSQPC